MGHPGHVAFPAQAFWLGAGALVVPLSLLLFLQWPLREWLQAWSRQANDLAQILFAVYVAVAITAASRANTHLAAHKASDQPTRRQRIWRSALILLCVGPWSVFMLWAAAAPIARSVAGFERFSETFVPGYFIIKLALALLLLLVLLEAVGACRSAWRAES
jgi:TRAP-type C4-dicarboxylate transport system permease small subunit